MSDPTRESRILDRTVGEKGVRRGERTDNRFCLGS